MQSPSLTITPSSPKMLCFIFIGYARGVRPQRASTIFVNYPLSCFYIRDGSLLLNPRRGGKSVHLEVDNYSSHCSGFNSERVKKKSELVQTTVRLFVLTLLVFGLRWTLRGWLEIPVQLFISWQQTENWHQVSPHHQSVLMKWFSCQKMTWRRCLNRDTHG